jgi:diguanylate cyclase (GGDEF)-like protein/PAS domain S-box-containing protein
MGSICPNADEQATDRRLFTGDRMTQESTAATVASRLLARIATRVGATLELDDTLDAIAGAVVEALGFRAAVVNLAGADDELHVVAVAGSEEVRASLLGTHSSLAAWESLLAASQEWGALRFLGHDTGLPADAEEMAFYVPELPVPGDDTGRWHPRDALFAPLTAADGSLLGVLSVDDPVDGMLPDPARRSLLEAFAVHAALAIGHAREHKVLQDSEEMLRRMFDESPVGKALFGPDGRYQRVNQAYCRFLGRQPEEFIGRRVVDFTHPDELDSAIALSAQIRDERSSSSVARVERRYLHADGRELWGRLSLARIGDGDETCVLAVIEDITESRAAEEQLRHLALHDSLTGLPNRSLIFDRLSQSLARSRRDGAQIAVIVVDVDHFKLVNDSYGHPAGDQLLASVAAALRGSMRESDTAGRMGGDEFIVICEGVNGPADAAVIAERLRVAVRVPIQIGEVTVIPSASLGCTVSNDESTIDQLVVEADTALYRAKSAGRGRFELYDDKMRDSSVAQLRLRSELIQALENDELRLHYQPIVDLAGGAAIGYEALLRWEHPTRGLLLPADFLAVVLDGDLDGPVTQWVLETACADIAGVNRATGSRAFVSVNLSPRQLGRSDLAAEVSAALEQAGLAARQLWLEITEEHLVDGRHRPMLDRLHALGCRIVLDDFGTGYSGLSYLQQLPVNVLKIDREFIARVGTDRVSSGITAAMADLADVLGIRVVAEGVETAAQAELLRGMGVPLAQGYFFGRPEALHDGLPAQVTTRMLPRPRSARSVAQPDFSTVNDSMTTG